MVAVKYSGVCCYRSGGSAAAATEAGAEVMTEAGTSNAAEVEKESLISAGEQSEMWAS